jgi:Beta protein
MKKYYPTLISRKGEIVALQYLKQIAKDNVCPVIEIMDDSLEKQEKEKNGSIKIVYKDEFENFLKTHWVFFDNEIVLDFSLVTDVESKIDLIKRMLLSLIKAGVNVIPAINIHTETPFANMIKDLVHKYELKICLLTAERTRGFDNFSIAIDKLFTYLGVDANRILILLDIGYSKYDRYNTLRDMASALIKSLSKKVDEWNSVILTSSSFPENLGEFKPQNNPNRITRYEWIVWKQLVNDQELSNVKYGDYGTKYAIYSEANFAGTISIKYTTEKDFVIYKGELTQEHPLGHKQYLSHADKLVKSNDYSGRDFSWGDKRIFEMAAQDIASDKSKPGSPTVWVQISQNHHIELINSLL